MLVLRMRTTEEHAPTRSPPIHRPSWLQPSCSLLLRDARRTELPALSYRFHCHVVTVAESPLSNTFFACRYTYRTLVAAPRFYLLQELPIDLQIYSFTCKGERRRWELLVLLSPSPNPGCNQLFQPWIILPTRFLLQAGMCLPVRRNHLFILLPCRYAFVVQGLLCRLDVPGNIATLPLGLSPAITEPVESIYRCTREILVIEI